MEVSASSTRFPLALEPTFFVYASSSANVDETVLTIVCDEPVASYGSALVTDFTLTRDGDPVVLLSLDPIVAGTIQITSASEFGIGFDYLLSFDGTLLVSPILSDDGSILQNFTNEVPIIV